MDRVVRDSKRVFRSTPRTASMRRHDRLFADPSVKHVSRQYFFLSVMTRHISPLEKQTRALN